MAEEMNGAAAIPGDAPAPSGGDLHQIEATAENVDAIMAQYMHTPLNTVVRGIHATILGVPSHKILLALCRCFGAVIGSGCSKGTIVEVLKRRGEYLDAFKEGIRSVAPEPMTKIEKPSAMVRPPLKR